MKSIRSKFGFICILILTVIILIPSTSSKYIQRFMTSVTVSTVLPYHNIWWSDSVGGVTGMTLNGATGVYAMNAGVASGSITLSNNAILISSETDSDLKADGYYLIIAKGGNGGRGLEMENQEPIFFNGGYGGIVAGVINFKPTQGDKLFVYLGTTGKDAECQKKTNSGVTSRYGRNLHPNTLAGGATRSAGVFSTSDSSVVGSSRPIYYFYNSGSGAGTMIFLNGISSSDNLLMVAGGGGSSSMKVFPDGSAGFGGNGGSNVVFYDGTNLSEAHHYENHNLILNGNLYWGIDGTGNSYGAGGLMGDRSANGSLLQKSLMSNTGEGGDASLLGGAGGGGYIGGLAGTGTKDDSGGGGGGASFISSSVNVTCDEASQASYKTCMQYLLDEYFYDANTNEPTFEVRSDGSIVYSGTDELERYSFFCLYYLGTSIS